MKKREFIEKMVYMAVLSMIFLLAAYILIKGGIVFGGEESFEVVGQFRDYAVSEFAQFIEKENIELIRYTLHWKEDRASGPLERYVSYLSPFQSFVLDSGPGRNTDTVAASNQLNQILRKQKINKEVNPEGTIGFIFGESYYEDTEAEDAQETLASVSSNVKLISQLKKIKTANFLLKNFYTVDSTTSVDPSVFQVDKFLKKDFTLKKTDKPQILIFHTHATSEAFSDSRPGQEADTIVGVGAYLADILSEQYGYNVIHDRSPYDMVNGKVDRNKAYNAAFAKVEEILKENPSIEVVIDLHRDGVLGKQKRLTVVNGKNTAQIMFFNGISRNRKGPINYLYNPNLQNNLAFSLQMKLACMEKYPDLTVRNFLKGYRYNTQLRERYLMIELGNQNNTLGEAKNAMEPLAEILEQILTGD